MKKAIPGLSLKITLDLLYFLCLPLLLIYYTGKKKYHSGWIERICLNRWRKILKEKGFLIWIHAVSLGEARLAFILYQKLKIHLPEYKYLFTTVTTVGEKYLRQHILPGDYLAYLPLDFSFLIRYIFSKLNLKALLILESEIWPNLVTESKRRFVPLGLINARISKKAYHRYRIIRPIITKILNLFDFVCLSGKIAEERFKALGARKEICYLTGSLKFDLKEARLKRDSRIENLKKYLTDGGYILFIAGSTHPVEDILVFKVYVKIVQKYPKLKFLIAPRHLEKSDILRKYVSNSGYRIGYFSQGFKFNYDRSIFLVDEIGFLPSLYNLAELVFVGGSLVSRGGHNIIEPAFFRKPILIGPYYHNFEEIVSEFIKNRAIFVCQNEIELQNAIEILSQDVKLRSELGRRAYETVLNNQGALEKTMRVIISSLK